MKVLFVCTGNTCRSNMAEAIFNKVCTKDNIKAYSAGISIIPLSVTSKNTALILKEAFDIDISKRQAVQLTLDMLKDSDLILTMTLSMKNLIISSHGELKSKVYSLREYINKQGDVVDPFGGDLKVYLKTFEMLKEDISSLVCKIEKDISN